LLPSLSRRYSDRSPEEYSQLLDWGVRLTLLLAVPAAAALALLAVPLVATLFKYGAFSASDVLYTRNAVVAYSLGLVGLILVKVLAPGFYARQDIRTPVKCAVITLIATQLMNLVFIWPLRHAGLALAIALGACLNAALLYRRLRQQGIYVLQPGWGGFLLRLLTAVVAMSGALWLAVGDTASWLSASPLVRVLHLAGLIALGAGVYFVSLRLLGMRLRDFSKRV
jgi:putative peptidoglycan lipid II flippase